MFGRLNLVKNTIQKQLSKNFHKTRMLRKEIEIFINERPYKCDSSYTIFQACYEAGEIIPRFCYHEKLSIAGNCRMCLVEVDKSPKPIAACAMPVMANMRILTKSEKTRIARGGVMEFLLANHPLDCPICDQGGECDLQDISEVYGYRRSRFHEYKRGVEDKQFGPLVKTVMTRCIHCGRCQRFSEEVAGDFSIGMTGRGRETEISTYVENLVGYELSGNIVDLCPVGALTNSPYSFKARPWELKITESIDILDPIMPLIQIDSRGAEVMRILPKVHEDVNEEWISDKSRHAFDGIKRQRLNVPMKKLSDGTFQDIQWDNALELGAQLINQTKPNDMCVIIGENADVESIVAIRDMFLRLGCENLNFKSNGLKLDPSIRGNYLMNSRIRGIEDCDLLLLIGTNPKTEAPVLNARIRRAAKNYLKIGVVGSAVDLTYEYEHLGNTTKVLLDILEGRHPFCSRIANAKLPMMVVGSSVFERTDGEDINKLLMQIVNLGRFINKESNWNGFNVLHKGLGNVGALEIGVPLYNPNLQAFSPKLVYLLGCDDFLPEDIPQNAKVIYQGTHGDIGASRADLILPGATYIEKSATYVSTEGRVNTTRVACVPPYLAKEDWEIIRALSETLGCSLPYDEIYDLRNRICELAPHLVKYDHLEKHGFENLMLDLHNNCTMNVNHNNLTDNIDNFYMTDAISRASPIMAKCSHAFNKKKLRNFKNLFVN